MTGAVMRRDASLRLTRSRHAHRCAPCIACGAGFGLKGFYFAFVPVVFLACSTNLLVKVLLTSTLALATSGELSLNTASTASAPFGSILPVSEYIGIVFLSAAR